MPGHVPDKLLPADDCASALAILRRRRAWLLSGYIHGIKGRPQDWLRPDS
jgi:hypothetical protein